MHILLHKLNMLDRQKKKEMEKKKEKGKKRQKKKKEKRQDLEKARIFSHFMLPQLLPGSGAETIHFTSQLAMHGPCLGHAWRSGHGDAISNFSKRETRPLEVIL